MSNLPLIILVDVYKNVTGLDVGASFVVHSLDLSKDILAADRCYI